MAPSSNPAKGLQQNRPRPTVPRTIIPAIPLPYVQKRKQQEAARAKAREEASSVAVVEAPTSPTPTPKPAEETSLTVNGSEDQESEKVDEPSEPAEASTPATPVTPAAPADLPVKEVEVVDENNTVAEAEVSSHEESEGKNQLTFASRALLT
jgi:hypothetical protein